MWEQQASPPSQSRPFLPLSRLNNAAHMLFPDGQSQGQTLAILTAQKSDPSSWGRCSRNTHRASVLFFCSTNPPKMTRPALSHSSQPQLKSQTSPPHCLNNLLRADASRAGHSAGAGGCQALSLSLKWRLGSCVPSLCFTLGFLCRPLPLSPDKALKGKHTKIPCP